MITIGVDAHKRVHMAVALDAAGREVARWRGPNSADGWQQLRAWGAALGARCRWGIEGAWNYGRGLAQHLLLQLDPDYAARLPKLQTQAGLRALEAYATADGAPTQQQRAAAVRRLAQRLKLALEQINALTATIEALAAPRFAPLAAICGISLLTAGALAGILGPGRRFRSDAQLAAYAGAAPVEASSAERVRHRLNRGGNRRLNAIVYRIALTQLRCSPAAQAYLARRVGEGKTRREAVRALKRYIVRAIWQQWQACQAVPGEAIALAA